MFNPIDLRTRIQIKDVWLSSDRGYLVSQE